MTQEDYKYEQSVLRNNLIAEVKRYLGYAEDVHGDYISVNEKTFDVDYRSRHDDERKPDLEYYNVLDLMKRQGLWFEPDEMAIETIVQEHLPSPNIKAKYDEWIESIKSYLISEKPTALHFCRFAIGTSSLSLDCFIEDKKNNAEEAPVPFDEEELYDCEELDIVPMRKVVTKTSTGYSISGYKLTKLILQYINPE